MACRDVRAVGVCYSTKLIDTCYESTDEAEIDEGYEKGIAARPMVGEESSDCPGCGENRDDEETEYVVWRQGISRSILVDKPRQHSKCRDQSNNLEKAPKGKH